MLQQGKLIKQEDGSLVVQYPVKYATILIDPSQAPYMNGYVDHNVDFSVKTIAIGEDEFSISDYDVAHIVGTPRKPRSTKSPRYEYGILVTKPWSNEMYAHNDKVAKQARQNLLAALTKAYDEFVDKDDQVHSKDNLYIIAKAFYGYGWSGSSAIDVYNDAQDTLFVTAAFWLNDIYPYLVKQGYVEQIDPWFVGYNKQ